MKLLNWHVQNLDRQSPITSCFHSSQSERFKYATFSLNFSHDRSPLQGQQEISFLGNTSSDDDDSDEASIKGEYSNEHIFLLVYN